MPDPMSAPNFSVGRFLGHRRGPSSSDDEDHSHGDRRSSVDGKSSLQLPQDTRRRASSMLSSTRRKPAPSPVTTRGERSGRISVSPLAFSQTIDGNESSTSIGSLDIGEGINDSPIPKNISKKAATMLGLKKPPTNPSHVARPNNPAPQAYEPEFYGVKRISISVSDPNLAVFVDSKEEPERRASMDNVSEAIDDDVQELIRETDEAFDAVGSALDDVRLGSPAIRAISSQGSPPSPGMAYSQQRRESISKLELQDDQETSSNSDPTQSSPPGVGIVHAPTAPLPPARSMRRNMTAASLNRTQTQGRRKPRQYSRGFSGFHGLSGHTKSGRWGISEGVHDILTGQRFKKPEVEELLTPARMEQLKKKREQAQRRTAAESKKLDDEKDKAEEAIDSSNSDSDESPANALDTVDVESKDQMVPSETTQPEKDAQVEAGTSEKSHNGDRELVSADVISDELEVEDNPPTPPEKNPARVSPLIGQSSTPELSDDESDQSESGSSRPGDRISSSSDNIHLAEEDDDYIYLKSTPYTMTKPTFKHGPITFSKAELGKAALTLDDTMDWTAFQMAILGGAGELITEDMDDDDEEFGRELTDFMTSIGADEIGKLVPADDPPRPISGRSGSLSSQSSLSSEEDLPIPCDTEQDIGRDLSFSEVKFYRGSGQRRWPNNGSNASKRYAIHQKQGGLDIMAPNQEPAVAGTHDEGGDGIEQVPMGYNLNQDLGAYLKYEQQHMGF